MKKLSVLFIAGALSMALNAQKIVLRSGSLAPLKSVKEIGVTFSYNDMRVGKMSESEYLDKKGDDYNKKEPGRGDQWRKAWKDDRTNRFEPKFLELINKYGNNWKFTKGKSPIYIDVQTIYTEPGFNVGVARASAIINADVTVYSGDAEIAKLTIVKAPGATFGGYDFDTGVRIAESYAAAGKGLGKFFAKKAK